MANELVPVPVTEYRAITTPASDIRELVRENLGEGTINEFGLDRIKVPSGGGLAWTVPTADGNKPAEAVDGVIIHWRDSRAYWVNAFSGAGAPPDCACANMKMPFGVGDPGGPCLQCEYAKFGSKISDKGEIGRGQACKQMRLLFMVKPTSLLPFVVILPPTSIKPFGDYFRALVGEEQFYYGVVTSLTLAQEKNSGGITYSKVTPRRIAALDRETLLKIRAYKDAILPILEGITIEQGDIEG